MRRIIMRECLRQAIGFTFNLLQSNLVISWVLSYYLNSHKYTDHATGAFMSKWCKCNNQKVADLIYLAWAINYW